VIRDTSNWAALLPVRWKLVNPRKIGRTDYVLITGLAQTGFFAYAPRDWRAKITRGDATQGLLFAVCRQLRVVISMPRNRVLSWYKKPQHCVNKTTAVNIHHSHIAAWVHIVRENARIRDINSLYSIFTITIFNSCRFNNDFETILTIISISLYSTMYNNLLFVRKIKYSIRAIWKKKIYEKKCGHMYA